MRRFAVDAVEPATERLPTGPLGARYRDALAVGGDPETPVIDHGVAHPLLASVAIAFAQHRPLQLSPDAVWLTIAQGVAQHVRLNAEALRGRLVRHQGRERLTIETVAIPTDAASWAAKAAEFRALLAKEIGEGRARLFECDFSTSTDVEKLASQIVLFDAYSPYFSLWMYAICGIPEITLTGTVDDWRRIRHRIDVIAELDLAHWCRSLVPITDQFVRAAEGNVDLAFWRRIYNPVDAYGGEMITGWVTRFYPYVEDRGALTAPNPMLELPIDEPKNRTTRSQRSYSGPGLRSDSIPATVSRVVVHIVDHVTGEQRRVELVAGVLAVAQAADGTLCPVAGWHVEPATVRIDDIAERILREHRSLPAPVDETRRFLQGPMEVVALFSRIDSATLFEGERAWRLRAPREQHSVHLERGQQFSIQRIADLPAGQSLCAASNHASGAVHWLLCRLDDEAVPQAYEIDLCPGQATALDAPSEIRLLAGPLAAILDAALASDGDIDHLEVGRFDELLRP